MPRGRRQESKIVVGVDGSVQSQAAVVWAVDHARESGRHVQLVNVWQVPPEVIEMPEREPVLLASLTTAEFQASALEEQHAAIEAARSREESQKARHELRATHLLERARDAALDDPEERRRVELVALRGDAGPELVRQAGEGDLIVVGSHRRTRAGATMLGSASLYCSLHATCPVVILPARRAIGARPQRRPPARATATAR